MKLTDLRGILQYIPQFREKTFIINVDGAVVTDENFANILVDIAVLRSLSIRVVLAHGASAQIRALAAEQGITASNLDGTGITDEATLKLALTASNRLTHEILEGLSAIDLRAASSNAVIAHPVGILHGKDHLFTGKVERVDTEMLQQLTQGFTPEKKARAALFLAVVLGPYRRGDVVARLRDAGPARDRAPEGHRALHPRRAQRDRLPRDGARAHGVGESAAGVDDGLAVVVGHARPLSA